jgi:predicted esterase
MIAGEDMSRYLRILMTLIVLSGSRNLCRGQDDVADVSCDDLKIAGNEQQRYFLIGAKADQKEPEGGYALLLVLPGGDGSADFNSFVRRIWKNALPPGFLIAQLVSVPSNNQNQIVWPTAKDKEPKQKFTTEDFIKTVVADVKSKHQINDAKVYALGWSSGGPAVYASMLSKDTPLKGAYVAMSVFTPAKLPPLAAAKGQNYFLLQSPQDQVTKYQFARNAKSQLTNAGAKVELRDYDGGHGWQGDVYGNIRAGIEWLAQQ